MAKFIFFKNLVNKNTGGLAEEVDEKTLQAAFIPFGENQVNIPLDYQSGNIIKYKINSIHTASLIIKYFINHQMNNNKKNLLINLFLFLR